MIICRAGLFCRWMIFRQVDLSFDFMKMGDTSKTISIFRTSPLWAYDLTRSKKLFGVYHILQIFVCCFVHKYGVSFATLFFQ